MSAKRGCNCKNSRCLKLYCECFASGQYCDPSTCNCKGCQNNHEFEEVRAEAVELTLERNPQAFRPKIETGGTPGIAGRHHRGCHCKKSGCLKKYCECFQAGILCSENCKCNGCKNFEGSTALASLLAHSRKGRGGRRRTTGAAAPPAAAAAPPSAPSPPPTAAGLAGPPVRAPAAARGAVLQAPPKVLLAPLPPSATPGNPGFSMATMPVLQQHAMQSLTAVLTGEAVGGGTQQVTADQERGVLASLLATLRTFGAGGDAVPAPPA